MASLPPNDDWDDAIDAQGEHFPHATREQVEQARKPTPGPSATDPLAGLLHLSKVAVYSLAAMKDLAARPVPYVWAPIAVSGTIVLLAGGPGEGKTTLLFLILASRLNLGAPVHVLGREVLPMPEAMWAVVIEGEHSESSAARKLFRSLKLLGIHEAAAGRMILVARKAVRIGSPEWEDVVRLIHAGLVSDVVIDTIARVAPADSNSEQEQAAIFELVTQAIDAAPSEATKPTVWAAAHTRKNGKSGDVSDVSGSVQRVGQADSVLMIEGEKVDGRTVASKVTFGKLREEPDEYPVPVTFAIDGDAIRVTESDLRGTEDPRPLETRIVEMLAAGPMTKNDLAHKLGRSKGDVDEAISALFTSREILSTDIMKNKRPFKAFRLKNDDKST